eukprot:3269298-Prymnesium_polylepis.1
MASPALDAPRLMPARPGHARGRTARVHRPCVRERRERGKQGPWMELSSRKAAPRETALRTRNPSSRP